MHVTVGGDSIPLGTGPPTKEELIAHYPAQFTFHQLKTFVNSGDLGLLKRDQRLQQRYDLWAEGVKAEYGTIINYLTNHRLQWGKPDGLSKLKSELVEDDQVYEVASISPENSITHQYFTADTPRSLISIIQNDWPYSVPPEVEHTLIWTRVPIFHPAVVPKEIESRVNQDGLWGFTGLDSPPPSPSNLPSCLPALSAWGITFETMIRSEKGTEEEEELVRKAGNEVHEFVRRRWDEDVWETAWFVNPPRLQSVPGLAHIHVFAKKK
ncbi:hypothetical protein DL96DRAFT_1667768 [Flagelloscypha sp. PMI_526]|nr:hypothetical protein DL96DRAFT_1667768 [Flagelloscypha sp. PMI_526]